MGIENQQQSNDLEYAKKLQQELDNKKSKESEIKYGGFDTLDEFDVDLKKVEQEGLYRPENN